MLLALGISIYPMWYLGEKIFGKEEEITDSYSFKNH